MLGMTDWAEYFRQNRDHLMSIPWDTGGDLSDKERDIVARSISEFQLGESSEGKSLFRSAEADAAATGDRRYFEALHLFINEEHRHSRDLGRFMRLNGIEFAKQTISDSVFRRLRKLFGSLEVSIAVLVTAEVIAQVYYVALRDATKSRVLRTLCEQIIRDEDQHVEFQSQMLARLRAGRWWIASALTTLMLRGLFFGTLFVVWRVHAPVFKAGDWTFGRYWKQAWIRHREMERTATPRANARDLQRTRVPFGPRMASSGKWLS